MKRLTIIGVALLILLAAIGLVASWRVRTSGRGNNAPQVSQDHLWPVKVDGKWGYMDRAGKLRIRARFFANSAFSEGRAPVKTSSRGKYGYIDMRGKVVVKPQYEVAKPFSEGLAAVSITPPAWIGVGEAKNGSTTLSVHGVSKYGYIDKAGNMVIEPQYRHAGQFSDGLAGVLTPTRNAGFINKVGEYVIRPTLAPAFAYHSFSEGLLGVRVDDKWGYMDKTGEIVIEPVFAAAGSFRNGIAAVKDAKGKYGFIDKSGKYIIEPAFAFAGSGGWSDDNRIAVVGDASKKLGYIDMSGEYVIEPQFTAATPFTEGLAAVGVGRAADFKWGYINEEGEFVIEPQFASTEPFLDGLAVVVSLKNRKWGVIDHAGKFVIPPKFDEVVQVNGIFAVVIKLEKLGYMDRSGNYIWEPRK